MHSGRLEMFRVKAYFDLRLMQDILTSFSAPKVAGHEKFFRFKTNSVLKRVCLM
jgi:hypothetical protein